MAQRKPNKIVYTVFLILLILLFCGAIGLLIWQIVMEGFQSDTFLKGTIIIFGLLASIVKVFVGRGEKRKSLSFYADAYPEELNNAFLRDEQKKARKELLEGIRFYNENCYDKAIMKLLSALKGAERTDDFAAAYLFLALCYTDMKLPDMAIHCYEELLHYKSSHARAWSNLGRLYLDMGRREEGIAAYKSAMKADPNYAVAYNNLAQALVQECRYAEAIPYAEKALALESGLTAAANALAIAHYALGHEEDCRKYVEYSVRRGGDREALEMVFKRIQRGASPLGNSSSLPSEVSRALDIFRRENARSMAAICIPGKETGLRSRVGGSVGIAPIGENGKPMRLLAAIWCSEVHGVPDFPETGVLRFYLEDADGCGIPCGDPSVNRSFRVLYDEDESAFAAWEACALVYEPVAKYEFPVAGCYPVYFEPMMGTPLFHDYRFEQAMNQVLVKAGAETMDAMSPSVLSEIIRENIYGGHRIGGYPCFEQNDPRSDERYRKYDTLLLQLVTHGDEEDFICFGNEGGCQFFIEREKLRAKDFSDILFYWDDTE